MYVFRGLNPEEPVQSNGYLCSFSDLCIKSGTAAQNEGLSHGAAQSNSKPSTQSLIFTTRNETESFFQIGFPSANVKNNYS